MITRLLKLIYSVAPRQVIHFFGRSLLLKPIRDRLLRNGNSRRVLTVKSRWGDAEFLYTADIKSAIKAEQRGIESTLLRLSIELVRELKGKNSNAVVLDIGSSYGFLSTVWALTICAKGKVYGFEASKFSYETALDSATSNRLGEAIQYTHVAVWSKNGIIKMNMNDGTHANMQDNGTNSVEVNAITIDTFCEINRILGVDLIKVDVDGPEFEVLQGAVETIESERPILIVESNGDSRIGSWLVSKGYDIFDLYMNVGQLDSLPPNIVAIPKEIISQE